MPFETINFATFEKKCNDKTRQYVNTLPWRHNGHDSVSIHQPYDCLPNRLFERRSIFQSSASLAFVRGIHRGPVNSPHKWPVTRKMFPFDDVTMMSRYDVIKWDHFLRYGPLCGEFTGPGEFPAQWPVTRSFEVFFDLRLNKRLSKQPWGWWFEMPPWSLWRRCNVLALICTRHCISVHCFTLVFKGYQNIAVLSH